MKEWIQIILIIGSIDYHDMYYVIVLPTYHLFCFQAFLTTY